MGPYVLCICASGEFQKWGPAISTVLLLAHPYDTFMKPLHAFDMDAESFIQRLPKAELHVHIEGTLEPTLVRTLAARNNIPLPPSLAALEQDHGYAFHDLPSFLAVYYGAMSVLQTTDDFHDLTWAYLLKCKEQNIIHAEIFFDPQAHLSRGVAFQTVITGIRNAVVKAKQELDVDAELIMCFLRDLSADSALDVLNLALPFKEWIVGVGLDSDEKDNPPLKFEAAFRMARKQGWKLTCHCDIDQVNGIEHIRQAIDVIGVDRIDHGTNIVEDSRLLQVVKEKGIGLTCCPISNGVVTADFKGKEISQLLRQGVKVTINSDDPAYFRGYMSENLIKLYEGAGLSMEEVVQTQRNALEVSWISDEKRGKFLEKLDDFTAATCDVSIAWNQQA